MIKSDLQEMNDMVMLRMFRNQEGYKLELTSENNVSFLYVCSNTLKKTAEGNQELEMLKETVTGEKVFELEVKNSNEAVLVVSEE